MISQARRFILGASFAVGSVVWFVGCLFLVASTVPLDPAQQTLRSLTNAQAAYAGLLACSIGLNLILVACLFWEDVDQN